MANQQFSDKFRECLWKVHGKRCLYCENPIRFIDLEIDHFIPEYLLHDPLSFENIKVQYALDDHFKIDGLENLAPSCFRCNSGKSSRIFTIGQVAIFLAKINAKQKDLNQCLESKGHQQNLDRVLITIGKAIEAEIFSKTELFDALKKKGYINFNTTVNYDLNISSKAIVNAIQSQNLIQEDTQIIFSYHAMQLMKDQQISPDDVVDALQGGVRVENISTQQNSDRLTYKIRTHDGLVVIFQDKDTALFILTSYWE